MSQRNGRVRRLLGVMALVVATGCNGSADRGSGAVQGAARLAVNDGPDFVVASVTGPASVLPWQSVTFTVTVCNQGTQPGSASLEVYFSDDDVITPNTQAGPSPDYFAGSMPMPSLNPGQCQVMTLQSPATVPSEGAYYLGAVVDPQDYVPEVSEANNSTTGNRIGIGNKPDFVVTSVTGPASVELGRPLTVTVTVCNQGTQAGSAPVEVYFSADTVITPNGSPSPSPDAFMASVPTPPLNPGQCQPLAVQGGATVPSEGAYYLGAVVDPSGGVPELIEDNNTLAGGRIGIGSQPDFVVTAVTGPASVERGQPLTVTVTVCNQGTQQGRAPVEVYVSADTVITPSTPWTSSPDYALGSVLMPTLNPGQCQSLPVQGMASVPSEGAYYLGAVVDPSGGMQELIEDNNATAGNRIGIGSMPDFVVASVTGPASVEMWQTISATVTVCNQGTQAGSAPVDVYVSSDAVITADTPWMSSPDDPLAHVSTPMLNPGECQALPVQGSVSVSSEGAYYLGAVIDPSGTLPELIKDNNTTTGDRLGIGSKPDFVVTSVAGPASVELGQPLSVTVTVCNQGTQPGSAPLELYLSSDAVITPNTPWAVSPDYALGAVPTPTLNPGECQQVQMQGSASVPTEGAYYLGAVVDPSGGMQELIEDNNATTGNRLGIGSKPDFVVTSVTGPASVAMGQPLSVTLTVCNQGTQPGNAPLEIYLSPDTVITPNMPWASSPDYGLGGASTTTLNPGECQTLTVQGSASVPSEGTYYFGAVIDPPGGLPELLKDNNTTVGGSIIIG